MKMIGAGVSAVCASGATRKHATLTHLGDAYYGPSPIPSELETRKTGTRSLSSPTMTKKRVERFRRTNGRQLCFVASAVAATLAACCIGMLADGTPASAHGIAGDRVFPATIVIDDPAVGDELSLPTFSTIHNSATNGNVGSREFDYGAEWDKTITEDLGVNFNFDYTVLNFDDGTNASGWQDPAFTLKYKLYVNPEHEILTSVGVIRTFGGTGSSTVDNPIGSTTPTIYVGKGLGDLPVLGALFRSQNFQKGDTELVILVTPHLAKPMPKNKVKLPTDSFVEPSDLDFYLWGHMEGTAKPTTTSGTSGS